MEPRLEASRTCTALHYNNWRALGRPTQDHGVCQAPFGEAIDPALARGKAQWEQKQSTAARPRNAALALALKAWAQGMF